MTVGSEMLPTEIVPPARGKADLEVRGVRFVGAVKGDKLFQKAHLPKGWKKVPTNHSMWFNLLDGKGQIVARIFYKEVSGDRRASMDVIYRD